MVEVDPRLFVTCRLCLDVEGQFQIVPSVQQQIKFCFDIDVEPFDRLPQLICKKCENILRNYYAIKKEFLDKQEQLKTKVQDNAKVVTKEQSPPLDVSTNKENHTRKRKLKIKRVTKRIKRLSSSSSDENQADSASPKTQKSIDGDQKDPAPAIEQKKITPNEEPKPWETNLNKYLVCRICSQKFNCRDDITKHIAQHSNLWTKYKNIFSRSCLVTLEKIDNKQNMISNINAVVHSADSIIRQSKYNPNYYIEYNPKDEKNSYIMDTQETQSINKESDSESTDDENLSRKRRRIISRSSNETVVIKQQGEDEDVSSISVPKDNNIPPTVIDCIDIDDSSDNESYESCDKHKNTSSNYKNEETNVKSIHNIVKMCYNRYAKRNDSSERKRSENNKLKESYLQHKLLSIGIKVINNKGFTCTGLLRYLENKDLSVVWKETSNMNASADGKYVRIATRMKGNDSSTGNNIGWKTVAELDPKKYKTKNRGNIFKKLNDLEIFRCAKKPNVESVTDNEENLNSVEHLPRISSVFSHTDLEISKTIDPECHLRKLLNTNPVSNPKQLPKKFESSAIKITKVFSAANKIGPSLDSKQTDESNKTNFNIIPIYTSGVSLTPVTQCNVELNRATIAESVNSSSKNCSQPTYPRIKVKPVSELMPDNTNEYISTDLSSAFPNNVQAVPTSKNISNGNVDVNNKVVISNVWPNQIVPLSEQQNCQISLIPGTRYDDPANVAKDFVWLHTSELPNTKTESPFQYLKNLLLIHNINLLDTDAPLPSNAVSLIKLRLVYQQEKCQPVPVLLTLFCYRDTFSIKVKDMQHREINISKLTAHWQLQLLKVYSKDISNKLLESASKINTETYENTNRFINVINSIRSR